MKALLGTEVKHWMKQLDEIGLLPTNLRWIAQVVVQSYKGHVTIVPSPTIKDYTQLLDNLTPETYWPAL